MVTKGIVAAALIALVLGLAPRSALAGDAGMPHAVVLKDGSQVPSRSRPVIAFGQVRYTDGDGRLQILGSDRVDLDATRTLPSYTGTQPPAMAMSVLDGGAAPAAERAGWVAPPVKLYSATWCPHCRSVKTWLGAHGVKYDVVEVDLLPQAEQAAAVAEMVRFAGRAAYPTLKIGSRVIQGYSPSKMAALLTPPPETRPAAAAAKPGTAAGAAAKPATRPAAKPSKSKT